MKAKLTWQQKLHNDNGLPKVVYIGPVRQSCIIPSPVEVDALMRQIPKGKVITFNELRAALARKHKTEIACPLTTGIFAWIAAHAANEAETAGKKRITPYWRTLRNKGELNPKYPGSIPALTKRLRAEGHKVVRKGKRYFVIEYDRSLASLKG